MTSQSFLPITISTVEYYEIFAYGWYSKHIYWGRPSNKFGQTSFLKHRHEMVSLKSFKEKFGAI